MYIAPNCKSRVLNGAVGLFDGFLSPPVTNFLDCPCLQHSSHQPLSLMQVHHLYGDPSIGHSINVVLVRTIILEEQMVSGIVGAFEYYLHVQNYVCLNLESI